MPITFDDAIGVVRKEVEILKARQAISEEVLKHLREIDSLMFGFGIYDPATVQDLELARLLRPHIDALKAELHF